VNHTCAALIGRYRNSPLPLVAGKQAHADLVLQLCTELAIGFKIVVNAEITEYRPRAANPVPLQLAIQRTLLCLGWTYWRATAFTRPSHRCCGVIFTPSIATATKRGYKRCHCMPPRTATKRLWQSSKLTCVSLYLRSATPYQFMQGEADELYRRIGAGYISSSYARSLMPM